MAEQFSVLKTSKKSKKDFLVSKTSIYSGNSSFSEVNGGRISSFRKGQKLCSISTSLNDHSALSGREELSYDEYELEYSTFLLRKVQNHLLAKNKKEKHEKLKKCLVSLKFELEDLLEKHLNLARTSMYIEMYMESVEECNKRIELGKIIKVFEENKLDVLFNSVSRILEQAVNQLSLIGLSKCDVEKFFNQEIIGDDSELIDCLKKIVDFSNTNKTKIEEIAMEILKVEKLFKENSVLRERYQCNLENITTNLLQTSYETLTDIVKKAFSRRIGGEGNCSESELLKLEEVLQATLQPFTSEQINSLQLSKVDSVFADKPTGTSTPHTGY